VAARLAPGGGILPLTIDGDLALGAAISPGRMAGAHVAPRLDNPEPLFRTGEVELQSVSAVGDGKHLRLGVRDASGAAEAIGFGLGERARDLAAARRCELAFVPVRNEWRGETRVQLKVKGVRVP